MNRERAKELKYIRSKQSDSISFDRLDFFLDEIFDDFESRVCGNCKYGLLDKDKELYCDESISDNYDALVECSVSPTFGCNKFKRKDK